MQNCTGTGTAPAAVYMATSGDKVRTFTAASRRFCLLVFLNRVLFPGCSPALTLSFPPPAPWRHELRFH